MGQGLGVLYIFMPYGMQYIVIWSRSSNDRVET